MAAATDVLISVVQIALGGTVVQGAVALFRRKGELKQLDRQTDSVAIDTADKLILMLRRELEDMKSEAEVMDAKVGGMVDRLAAMTEELALARAEVIRYKYPRGD